MLQCMKIRCELEPFVSFVAERSRKSDLTFNKWRIKTDFILKHFSHRSAHFFSPDFIKVNTNQSSHRWLSCRLTDFLFCSASNWRQLTAACCCRNLLSSSRCWHLKSLWPQGVMWPLLPVRTRRKKTTEPSSVRFRSASKSHFKKKKKKTITSEFFDFSVPTIPVCLSVCLSLGCMLDDPSILMWIKPGCWSDSCVSLYWAGWWWWSWSSSVSISLDETRWKDKLQAGSKCVWFWGGF